MNSIERVFTALRRKEPDRVPTFEWEIHPDVISAILPGATLYDFIEQMDIDGISILENVIYEDVEPGVKRDHWGVLRDFRSMPGLYWPVPLHEIIEREEDLDDYVPPDPHDPRLLSPLRDAVKHFKGKKPIIYITMSSFLYPSFLRGMGNLCMDYKLNPNFAKRLTNMVVDYFVELEKDAIKEGADIIVDADDYCGKNGPFMSPTDFKEFVLPGLQKVVDVAKDQNIPFIKHFDGFVWPILDMVIETGIDAINPIEPSAGMDIGEVKRVYGDRVAIAGNIDCTTLLTFGTPDEVRESVKECIRVASPGGGHIITSSNTIHRGVKPENYFAMLEAVKEFGRYPINIKL